MAKAYAEKWDRMFGAILNHRYRNTRFSWGARSWRDKDSVIFACLGRLDLVIPFLLASGSSRRGGFGGGGGGFGGGGFGGGGGGFGGGGASGGW